MSSSSTFHPGFTFATLVVQFAMTRGLVITNLEARKKGDGETSDAAAVAAQPSSTGVAASSSSAVSSASITPSAIASSTASVSKSTSSTSNISNTSSSPSSPTSPSGTVVRSDIDITKAGIVGIAIGSVAILVLALMFLTKCIRRHRKKIQVRHIGPTKGFLRIRSSSPPRPQTPVTEMSQTQSSPLISSAVVAGATTNPHLSHHSMSNTTASLSPLMLPSASLQYTTSVASTSATSARSAANTHTSGAHTEISSHDALSYVSSPGGIVGQHGPSPGLRSIVSRSTSVTNSTGEPGSPVSEPSELHHAMTMYQKSLENDPKGLDVGHMHTDKVAEGSEDVNDPPPSYDEL